MTERPKKPHVVIVGGGFGGLRAAVTLARHPLRVEVTLIDRRNHHLFQPLLYQVAMAGLSPADIAVPIRQVFRSCRNVSVILGEVTGIDPRSKQLHLATGSMNYDYCVLACGSRHSYFGHKNWESYAPGLKTLEQATEIRRRVLMAFEQAESSQNQEERQALLTFVVVGGGPTGVELAGAIGEISRYTLAKDFRQIDPTQTRIVLIEASERVLGSFAPELSARTSQALERLGVEVWLSSRVGYIDDREVRVGERRIPTRTVLWAAGVEPAELNVKTPFRLGPQGGIEVSETLQVPEWPHVFCVGDQAHHPSRFPGLAPVAVQQGAHVARSILRMTEGRQPRPFRYIDKGQLATIGRHQAAMQLGSWRSFGLLAWMMWMFVHIYYLVGFSNRLIVFWRWAWHYLTYRKGARLITQNASSPADPPPVVDPLPPPRSS